MICVITVSQLSESNMHIFMQNLAGKRQVPVNHIYMVKRFQKSHYSKSKIINTKADGNGSNTN